MIVEHVKPEAWADTDEAGKIQPSEVAGLVHVVTLEPGDMPAAAMPAGAVLFFAMQAAPAGWLICDGRLLSRTAYAALFDAIGATFGAGDGLTTFALPDLRGEFIRGWHGGRNVDGGRAFGSAQGDEFKSHEHTMPMRSIGAAGTVSNGFSSGSGVSSGAAGGGETRPRNIALLPCISTGA